MPPRTLEAEIVGINGLVFVLDTPVATAVAGAAVTKVGATALQIAPGTQYGLSIDAPTGHYVLDSAKTAHPVMMITSLPGRGKLPGGDVKGSGSGGIGDINPRVIAKFIATATQ